MLNSVEVESAQGSLLTLPLEDVVNGLLIEEITGLDPVKATITSSTFAQQDGSQYQSSRREDRNIVMTISLEPDWGTETVRDLRHRLYNYFMPKSWVKLRFNSDDMNPVEIVGRVESFETALFSAEPAVNISILCGDPDFVDPTTATFSGLTTSSTVETMMTYDGSTETGYLFTLRPNRSITSFSIFQRGPSGENYRMDFDGAMIAGDTLKISTISGAKYARIVRSGIETSILYGVAPQSDWLEFQPGDNYIRVYALGAGIPYDITYVRKYGGL